MKTIFIDVREPQEFSQGHVEGALNIPPSRLVSGRVAELENVPKDAELVVYCISGSRSNASIPYIRALGFTNITNGINRQHVESKYF